MVGAVVGWLFTLLNDENLPWRQDAMNLIVGLLLAFAVTDYVIPPDMPKLGLFAGLLCGAMGGYALLVFREMLPDLLRTAWDAWIDKQIARRDRIDPPE